MGANTSGPDAISRGEHGTGKGPEFACPYCGRHDVYYRRKSRDYACKKCGLIFTRSEGVYHA